jgi:hypothetical protein
VHSGAASRDGGGSGARRGRGGRGIDRPLLILLVIVLFVLCLALLGSALTGAAAS